MKREGISVNKEKIGNNNNIINSNSNNGRDNDIVFNSNINRVIS